MVLFRHFSLVIARQLLLQGSPMIFASIWSRINHRFLFCLTFQRPLTVYAMDCSSLCCVSATAGGGTRLFLSFSSVSKSCMWGRCFSSSPISGWCSSIISYIATLFLSVVTLSNCVFEATLSNCVFEATLSNCVF
jgi:hypothetical protein